MKTESKKKKHLYIFLVYMVTRGPRFPRIVQDFGGVSQFSARSEKQ